MSDTFDLSFDCSRRALLFFNFRSMFYSPTIIHASVNRSIALLQDAYTSNDAIYVGLLESNYTFSTSPGCFTLCYLDIRSWSYTGW